MTLSEFNLYFRTAYKNRTSSFLSGFILALSDAFALFIYIGLSFLLINLINTSLINFRSFIYYSFYFPLIIIVYYAAGLYPGIMISPSDEVRKLSICSAFCFIGICISIVFQTGGTENSIITITQQIVRDSPKKGVVSAFMLAVPLTSFGMSASREIARHIFGRFNWWGVPAVIYCTGSSADEVIDRLSKRPYLGYKPAVIIDSNAAECSMHGKIPVFPDTDEIRKTISELNIKVAILCDYCGERRSIMTGYRYTISISKKQDFFTSTMSLRDIGGIIGFSSTHNLTRASNLFIKRLLDLFIIVISSPLVIPLMLIIAVLVKLTSRGNVFYGHKRVGKNGKEIKCWKFRSMYSNSQEMLETILKTDPAMKKEWEENRKFVNDPRVTPLGKFLRKTSLDELPQLFNILAGSMSFVGPRPVTREELEKYGDYADFILSVTPGLSGMWQISGRSDTGYEERINLDTYYIQNWSTWFDMWIIIKTVWVVLNGKGAY